MNTERALQRYIVQQARDRGFLCDKLESRSRRGWPDLFIMHRHYPMPVFVEVKTPRALVVVPMHQLRVLQDIRDHGGETWVINTKRQVDDLLQHLEQRVQENRSLEGLADSAHTAPPNIAYLKPQQE